MRRGSISWRDRVDAGCTRDHQARALINLIITATISRDQTHLER